MPQYIDKSAVIEKIDDLISNLRYTEEDEALQIDTLIDVKNFIDTLEVKNIEENKHLEYSVD